MLFRSDRDWSTGKYVESVIEAKAIKITVANTLQRVKATRVKPKARAAKPVDVYTSRKVSQGVFEWTTPTGVKLSSFGYDAKAQERIKKETQARIDKALRSDSSFLFSREY